MTEWQPIETAPRDGCAILAARDYGELIQVVYWDDEQPLHPWAVVDSEISYPPPTFTHWMPLPEPPK